MGRIGRDNSESVQANPPSSPRVANALHHAGARRSRERQALRRLTVPLLLVIAIPGVANHPVASWHGKGLAVTVALVVVVASVAVIQRRGRHLDSHDGSLMPTIAALIALTAAGVTLVVVQPSGTGALVLALVAYIAGARLPLRLGIAVVGAAAVANTVALAAQESHPVTAITSSLLLAVLLFLMARLYQRAEADRERAEIATAQLADARDRELEAAAVAERSRIAGELHDVLAHSLSALSLQLEGARLLARRDAASGELVDALTHCRGLAANGLADAKRAVGALRGEDLPDLDDLPRLVEDFRVGGLGVELQVDGARRPVAGDIGLAVYRATQEALTNVVRHSGARTASVVLTYDEDRVRLAVTDPGGGAPALTDAGSGYGLTAMRERAVRLGGSVTAGPTGDGYRVEIEVPT